MDNKINKLERYKLDKPNDKLLSENSFGLYVFQKFQTYKKMILVIKLENNEQLLFKKWKEVSDWQNVKASAVSKAIAKSNIWRNMYLSYVYIEDDICVKKHRRFDDMTHKRFNELHSNIKTNCNNPTRYHTYENCTYDKDWSNISLFIEDAINLDGFELWINNPQKKISLSKSFKSNNNNHYSKENCSFITLSENSKHTYSKNKEKINNSVKKKVVEINIDNSVKKYWDSLSDAARHYKVPTWSIWYALQNDGIINHGSKWEYVK